MKNSFASRIRKLEERVANLIRPGTITAVQLSPPRVTVDLHAGDIISPPLPWFTRRAGNDVDWWAPEVGEQVVVICPSGDINQGFVLPAVYQTAFPAPDTSADHHITKYKDGTAITYDRAAHAWTLDVVGSGAQVNVISAGKVMVTGSSDIDVTSSEGAINLTASGKVTIAGSEIDLNGPVVASTTVTAQTDVVGGGKSLKTHVHTGVQSGGSLSGPPQ